MGVFCEMFCDQLYVQNDEPAVCEVFSLFLPFDKYCHDSAVDIDVADRMLAWTSMVMIMASMLC